METMNFVEEGKDVTSKEANDKIKELAEKQKIVVNVSLDQMQSLQRQWVNWDNNEPAEITFMIDGKTEAKLKVAAYSYSGKTCCAIELGD